VFSLRADHVPRTRGAPVAALEPIHVVPHARVTHARAWGLAQGSAEFASDALSDDADGRALHRRRASMSRRGS
jgi:hypothetical protein